MEVVLVNFSVQFVTGSNDLHGLPYVWKQYYNTRLILYFYETLLLYRTHIDHFIEHYFTILVHCCSMSYRYQQPVVLLGVAVGAEAPGFEREPHPQQQVLVPAVDGFEFKTMRNSQPRMTSRWDRLDHDSCQHGTLIQFTTSSWCSRLPRCGLCCATLESTQPGCSLRRLGGLRNILVPAWGAGPLTASLWSHWSGISACVSTWGWYARKTSKSTGRRRTHARQPRSSHSWCRSGSLRWCKGSFTLVRWTLQLVASPDSIHGARCDRYSTQWMWHSRSITWRRDICPSMRAWLVWRTAWSFFNTCPTSDTRGLGSRNSNFVTQWPDMWCTLSCMLVRTSRFGVTWGRPMAWLWISCVRPMSSTKATTCLRTISTPNQPWQRHFWELELCWPVQCAETRKDCLHYQPRWILARCWVIVVKAFCSSHFARKSRNGSLCWCSVQPQQQGWFKYVRVLAFSNKSQSVSRHTTSTWEAWISATARYITFLPSAPDIGKNYSSTWSTWRCSTATSSTRPTQMATSASPDMTICALSCRVYVPPRTLLWQSCHLQCPW